MNRATRTDRTRAYERPVLSETRLWRSSPGDSSSRPVDHSRRSASTSFPVRLEPHHQDAAEQDQGDANDGEPAQPTLPGPEQPETVQDQSRDELAADHQRE